MSIASTCHASAGPNGGIHCSSTTYDLLKDQFVLEQTEQETTYRLDSIKDNEIGVGFTNDIVDINRKLSIHLSLIRARQVYFKAEHKIINSGGISDGTSDDASSDGGDFDNLYSESLVDALRK